MTRGKANQKLEDIILDELKSGPKKMSYLVIAADKRRPGTTKQGVYATLRSLRSGEKVVTHRGFASLSNLWLSRMIDFFSIARRNYLNGKAKDESFLNLADGEKAAYFFRDPVQTDAFWSHAFTVLNDVVSPDKPLYLYNPHEWFILARADNESEIVRAVIARGRKYAMTIGQRTPLDSLTAKKISALGAECRLASAPIFPKENYYFNIFGDFLIEAYLDKKITEAIGRFFKTNPVWNETARKTLASIVSARGRSKLVISRNARKAARLAALLRSH